MFDHVLHDVVKTATAGHHRRGGYLLVERPAFVEQPLQLRAGAVQQQRPIPVQADPADRVGQAHVQEDDGVPTKRRARSRVADRAAPESDDALVLCQRGCHGGALQLPECRFAVVDEDVGD
jgi:hypothetical protein